MNFVGENEMILNRETVKAALEEWINRKMIVGPLRITSVKQQKSGAVSIKFVPESELARHVGRRASAETCTLKAGPAKDVPAGSGPAGAQTDSH